MHIKPKVVKLHKNMSLKNFFNKNLGDRKYDIIAEHAIEQDEEYTIITAAIKINRADPNHKKILNQMIEKQETPVVTFIKKLERANKNEIKCNENGVKPMYPEITLL